MKYIRKRPKGAATPSGLKNKQTSNISITVRLLFYNPSGNLFAETIMVFNNIYDFPTQQTLKDEFINRFLKMHRINKKQLEVCLHV